MKRMMRNERVRERGKGRRRESRGRWNKMVRNKDEMDGEKQVEEGEERGSRK